MLSVAEVRSNEILLQGTALVPAEGCFVVVAGLTGAVDNAELSEDPCAITAMDDAIGIGDSGEDGGGGGAAEDGGDGDGCEQFVFGFCPYK